jgi:hypothetical protein
MRFRIPHASSGGARTGWFISWIPIGRKAVLTRRKNRFLPYS